MCATSAPNQWCEACWAPVTPELALDHIAENMYSILGNMRSYASVFKGGFGGRLGLGVGMEETTPVGLEFEATGEISGSVDFSLDDCFFEASLVEGGFVVAVVVVTVDWCSPICFALSASRSARVLANLATASAACRFGLLRATR